MCIRDRDYSQVLEGYRKCLEIDPAFIFALYNIGNVYVKSEKIDAAQAVCAALGKSVHFCSPSEMLSPGGRCCGGGRICRYNGRTICCRSPT